MGTRAGAALAQFAISLALGLVLLFGATELLLRHHVVPQDSFTAHVAMLGANTSADAVFGDSHAARDFAPPAGMVNLAFPSESIDHMDWKARRYFSDRRPGRVIVQADPHLFAPYRLANRLGDYSAEIEDAGEAQHGAYLGDGRYRPQLVVLWKAFLRAGGTLNAQVQRTGNGALLSPGDLSEKSPRARRYEARSRVATHSQVAGRAQRERQAAFSRMLDFLAGRGATLCLVTLPVAPDYLLAFAEHAQPEARKERARTLTFFAAEAVRRGAVYVDHQGTVTGLQHFRDVDHLNAAGATAYSPRLLEDCFGAAAG